LFPFLKFASDFEGYILRLVHFGDKFAKLSGWLKALEAGGASAALD
jgi:hypothetical protein